MAIFARVSKKPSIGEDKQYTHIHLLSRTNSPGVSCVIFSHILALILRYTSDRTAHHAVDLACRNLQLQLSSFTVPNNGTEQQCGYVRTCFLIDRSAGLSTLFYLRTLGMKGRTYFPLTFYQCNNFYNLFLTTRAQHLIIICIIGELSFSTCDLVHEFLH